MLQSCYDLSYHRKFSSSRVFYGTIWGLFVSVSVNIYVYIVAAQMVSSFMIEDELNNFRELLKPIGTKLIGILEYYQGNSKLGAKVLLVTDIVSFVI